MQSILLRHYNEIKDDQCNRYSIYNLFNDIVEVEDGSGDEVGRREGYDIESACESDCCQGTGWGRLLEKPSR